MPLPLLPAVIIAGTPSPGGSSRRCPFCRRSHRLHTPLSVNRHPPRSFEQAHTQRATWASHTHIHHNNPYTHSHQSNMSIRIHTRTAHLHIRTHTHMHTIRTHTRARNKGAFLSLSLMRRAFLSSGSNSRGRSPLLPTPHCYCNYWHSRYSAVTMMRALPSH